MPSDDTVGLLIAAKLWTSSGYDVHVHWSHQPHDDAIFARLEALGAVTRPWWMRLARRSLGGRAVLRQLRREHQSESQVGEQNTIRTIVMTDVLLDLIEKVAALLPSFESGHALPTNAPGFPNDLEPVIRAGSTRRGVSSTLEDRGDEEV